MSGFDWTGSAAEIVDAFEDGVYVVDHDWRFVYANGQACRMWNLSRDDVIGRVLWERFPQIVGTDSERLLRAAAASRVAAEFEVVSPVVRRWLWIRVYPIKGAFTGVTWRDITERKRTEEAARQSTELLRVAMQAAQFGTWEFRPIEGTRVWSDEAKAVAGIPPGTEPSFEAFKAATHPDDWPRVAKAYEAAFDPAGSGEYFAEYRVIDRTLGRARWVVAQGRMFFDEQGRPARLAGVTFDIDRRKQADEAFRESQELFRRVFEQSPLGKATVGPDFRFREVNPALCQMLGYTAEELRRLGFLDLVHPDDRETYLSHAGALLSGEVAQFQLEERFLRKSGEPLWVSINVAPIRDAEGRPLYSLGIIENIDERKKTEHALRELNETLERQVEKRARQLSESRAHLRAFFDNSPDWLTLQRATADGRFIYEDLNPVCEQAYGLPRDRVIGRSVAEIFGAEAARLPLHHFRECLRTGAPQRYVAQRKTPAGTRTIDVMFVLVPAVAENGDRFLITTARDITDHNELEERLRQAQKMEAIGQLTGGLAHDFNNLLTAIIGNLELLERRIGGDSQTTRQAQAARRSAERGARLTEQLLAFSRKQHLQAEAVDINRLVTGMSDLLARTIGGVIQVQTALAPDLWPALIDPTQIEIAILNLAINARDAMPLGGTLAIETFNVAGGRDPGETGDAPSDGGGRDCICISVSDNGIGMTEDVLAHAFEPFYTTKEVGKGSGLGLSQVYGTVRQSGGGVQIDSRPGQGTTVRLYLPRTTAGSTRDSGQPVPAASTRSGRLLVADDDADVREITVQMLRDLGYGVTEADSGRAVLDAIGRGETYDLVVIDVAMPGLNGIETVRSARERWPDLRALLITGYADTSAIDESGGTDPLLKKPFSFHALDEAVRQALLPAAARGGGNIVPLRGNRPGG